MPNLSFWRSDHELVCFYRNQIGSYRTASFDTATGLPTPAMSSQVYNNIAQDIDHINQLHVSPDGRWLLWPGHSTTTHHLAWIASTFDGRQRKEWPCDDERYNHIFQWTQDSRHWVEIRDKTIELYGTQVHSAHVQRTCAVLYSLDIPSVKVLPVTLPIEECSGLWGLPSGQFIVADNSKLNFYDFSLTGQPARKFSAHLPEKTEVNDLAFSPDGSRIAWVLTALRRIKPTSFVTLPLLVRPQIGYAYSVYESDPTGGHLRQMYPEIASPVDFPNSIHWTPDGKRIGYWYQKSLWTVPAN